MPPGKTRTITLTGRPPVKIVGKDWPVIAHADGSTHDGHGPNPPNREWKRELRVRRHADGRSIVYGVFQFLSCWQGEDGAHARHGRLLPAGEADVATAIRGVALDLAASSGESPSIWSAIANDAIADLPAEVLA